MEPYTYSALDDAKHEIRLVDLLHGAFDDTICISIRHVPFNIGSTQPDDAITPRMPLDELQTTLPEGWKAFETLENEYIFENQKTEDTTWRHPLPDFDASRRSPTENKSTAPGPPSFEALSYTWGSLDGSLPLSVVRRATCTSTMLHAGPNLTMALRHLRLPDRARTLWIDSLCIDQSNLDERSHQVQRMADIYESASRVVIWLGEEGDDSNHAFDSFNDLGQQLELTIYGSKLRGAFATHKEWFRGSHSLPYDERTCNALSNLLKRPWFLRLWVVQEFHLANNDSFLQCGHAVITKPRFRRALGCLNDKRQLPPGDMRQLLNRVEPFIFDITHEPLDMLIWTYTDRLCSNPRDKVYALLGLSNPHLVDKIQPNYELSVDEVYKQALVTIIEYFGRLDHLRSMLSPCQSKERPSWVLDLAAEIDHPRTSWQFCSGLSSAEVRYTPPDILEVTGVRCATVSGLSRACPRSDLAGTLAAVKEWAPAEDGTYVTGETTMDAFVSCLRYNLFRERMPMTALPTLARWKERVVNELLGKDYDPSMAKDLEIWYSLRNCGNKVLVSTIEGYFGVSSVGIKEGDIICVLLGCSTPIVLRPVTDGFQVIGDCYLHGLNDAAALLGPLPTPWRVILTCITAYSYRYEYFNSESKERTIHDPRLPPLDPDWRHVPSKRSRDDPKVYEKFENLRTGEVRNSDPRLRGEALRKRGVALEKFVLV